MKWVLVNNMDEIVDTCEIASEVGVSGAKTYFMGIKRLKGKKFDNLWRVMSQEKYDLKFKVDGNKLQGYVDNQLLIEAQDSSNPFEEGMMGFLTENGAIQSNSISIE